MHDVAFERFHGEALQHLSHVWCMLSSLLRVLLTMDMQHVQHRQPQSVRFVPRSYLHVLR